MDKIWTIYGDAPKAEDNPEIILTKYAKQVQVDTENKFIGLVTETVRENTGEVSYALYIIAPELRDYMYRLIEVNLQNIIQPYPLDVTLFAKDPKNHRTFTCDTSSTFESRLRELITSPITQGILMHLKTLIEIKNA